MKDICNEVWEISVIGKRDICYEVREISVMRFERYLLRDMNEICNEV